MEAGDGGNDTSGLSESFLGGATGGQFVVEGGQEPEESMEETEPGEGEPLREQDRFLPIANVARIMKKSVPKNGKIAKDAKECVQECVSEFISFITSEASERCHQEKRKTINGEDLLFAMSTLGFDNYVEPLKVYLQKYRDSTKGDKVLNAQAEAAVEELNPDEFGANLQQSILTTDQGQNIVFAQAPYQTAQIQTQQINMMN